MSLRAPRAERIFDVSGEKDFEALALEVFRYQAACCPPYADFLRYLGVDPERVKALREIPFLPIELFKTHRICCGEGPESVVFTSSGTTGTTPSRHYVKDVTLYETSFRRAFERFYGELSGINLYALLPSYLEREGSSLIYMVEKLIGGCRDGGFFLHDTDALAARLRTAPADTRTILLGVTFALLDLAEKAALDLRGVTVMETGGMKGRRREMPREEVHRVLCERFGVKAVHSEYGMCECLSQAYSSGNGIFTPPPWMRVFAADIHDPFEYVPPERTGVLHIVDLANLHACSFLRTQDLGRAFGNGDFTVLGRLDRSDIRGCNLLIAE